MLAGCVSACPSDGRDICHGCLICVRSLPRPPRVPTFPPSAVLARAWATEIPAALATTSDADAQTVRPGTRVAL